MARAVVDLDARATVLDAAEKLASAPAEDDLTLVVAPGAPLLRNAVFFEVLRAQAAPRRLSVVTTDARARSIASSVHLPAYASLAALEHHELDPTEKLERPRRAASTAPLIATTRARPPLRRIGAIAGSLGLALLILAAVVLPQATVVVSPATQPLGPVDLTVKAGSGADVALTPITAPITAKVTGTATGSRTDQVPAKGTVQVENKTTDDLTIPKGTTFKTADGIAFASLADANLGRSVIILPFNLLIGRQVIPVQAVVAGPTGNVGAGRIVVSPDGRYSVTNPEATTGGDTKKIPIVKLEDYDAAVKRAPDALHAAAEDQLGKWIGEPRKGQVPVREVLDQQTSISPANVDVVGKEVATFDLTVSGYATAYLVPEGQPADAVYQKLRESATPGNDVDKRSVTIDKMSVKISDAPEVTWSITAHALQSKHVDLPRIARMLSGHQVRDAEGVLRDDGLQLVRLEWVPAWWPFLPLLDGRITVTEQSAPGATGQ
ncbi:MAG: baseplate J/gp47 family protein [Chloroflexota bacterium]|nr:baseplate J/gp47 family protein [Chloroflexota bacterium]MDE3192147.1 baseplate J/gp47 family protein [Chloroflexota bacterium]